MSFSALNKAERKKESEELKRLLALDESLKNDKPDECDSCNFETKNLAFYPGEGRRKAVWLCGVCEHSYSGVAAMHYGKYEYAITLKQIAYCTNMILEEIRRHFHYHEPLKDSKYPYNEIE
jgi:hypothetical protein